ncbi:MULTISPECIES: hypothetical protein [unclassified Microcoleus]|uniref:hypothetical protein n=1 Tax=unclassified Microcoleus TaxID=2642155 RepID=UPI002FCE77B3
MTVGCWLLAVDCRLLLVNAFGPIANNQLPITNCFPTNNQLLSYQLPIAFLPTANYQLPTN